MSARLDELLEQVRHLEAEMVREARQQETDYCYSVHAGKVRFADTVQSHHLGFRLGIPDYILHSRFLVLITSPVIWSCAIPIALADLVGSFYQAVCFPIYGIPKVRRSDYLAFDRRHLGYLNLFEKFNCEYCAYVNGILGYFTEIAARTEQHWCPIKHAGCVKCAHSRYKKFIEYGDAEKFRRQFETIRQDYADIAAPEAK
ncbi:MAG: hypothetical protein WDM96_09260 [Lacunisphaera sp.]